MQVVQRILPTGPAPKAGAVGAAQGAVVVQAVGVPQTRSGGCLPAQEVLAIPEDRLVDPLLGQHAAQGGDRAGQGIGVAVGVIAGVDADLVAAGVDLAQQGAQARVVQAEAVSECRRAFAPLRATATSRRAPRGRSHFVMALRRMA